MSGGLPPHKPINDSDIDRVLVKLNDGSTWIAEYKDDKLELVEKITHPAVKPAPPKPAPPLPPKPPTPPTPPRMRWKTISSGMLVGAIPTSLEEDDDYDDASQEAEHAAEKAVMEDSVFRSKLSNVMTDNMFDRRVRGRTRGRLDMKRLWKAETLATNVFEQKQARKNKAYNIVLLVDESGSMQGDKIDMASDIAVFLAKTFDGLNLNLSIIGFNAYMHLHKSFDEKLPNLVNLRKAMVYSANSSIMGAGYNNDFEAISFAYNQFKGRKGQNFLLMLSDGDPVTASSVAHALNQKNPAQYIEGAIKRGAEWALTPKDYMGKRGFLWVNTDSKLDYSNRNARKHLQALANANPDVASIGIGIESNCWQMPNHIRENNIHKLKPVLLREIEKKIKRG